MTALPDSIGELTSLRKLDLRWNKLRKAPEWLQQLEASGCMVYR